MYFRDRVLYEATHKHKPTSDTLLKVNRMVNLKMEPNDVEQVFLDIKSERENSRREGRMPNPDTFLLLGAVTFFYYKSEVKLSKHIEQYIKGLEIAGPERYTGIIMALSSVIENVDFFEIERLASVFYYEKRKDAMREIEQNTLNVQENDLALSMLAKIAIRKGREEMFSDPRKTIDLLVRIYFCPGYNDEDNLIEDFVSRAGNADYGKYITQDDERMIELKKAGFTFEQAKSILPDFHKNRKEICGLIKDGNDVYRNETVLVLFAYKAIERFNKDKKGLFATSSRNKSKLLLQTVYNHLTSEEKRAHIEEVAADYGIRFNEQQQINV